MHKEYSIQYKSEDGDGKWELIDNFTPTKSALEADQKLYYLKNECKLYSWMHKYRIVSRTISDWEVVPPEEKHL